MVSRSACDAFDCPNKVSDAHAVSGAIFVDEGEGQGGHRNLVALARRSEGRKPWRVHD
jgi:hypothetical protein